MSENDRTLIGVINWASKRGELFELCVGEDKLLCASCEEYGNPQPVIQVLMRVGLEQDFNAVEMNEIFERERITQAIIGTAFNWQNKSPLLLG